MEYITLKSYSKVFSDDKQVDQQSKPKKGILRRFGSLKRIGQIFNFSEFAFSSECGAGRTIQTEEQSVAAVRGSL